MHCNHNWNKNSCWSTPDIQVKSAYLILTSVITTYVLIRNAALDLTAVLEGLSLLFFFFILKLLSFWIHNSVWSKPIKLITTDH